MSDESNDNRLYPDDQARVDEYLRTGYNDVERKPFRPLYMMLMLNIVVIVFFALSMGIVKLAGISY